MVLGPVLVTVDPARTAKLAAVPNEIVGVAAPALGGPTTVTSRVVAQTRVSASASRVRTVILRTAPARRVVNMGFPFGVDDDAVELRSLQVGRVAPNVSSVSWRWRGKWFTRRDGRTPFAYLPPDGSAGFESPFVRTRILS